MNDISQEVNRELQKRRDQSFHRQQERKREIHERIPEFAHIESELKKLGTQYIKKRLQGELMDDDSFNCQTAMLQEKKSQLLTKAGYPKDYLEPNYVCPHCRDEGTVDGKICICKKQMLVSRAYQMSNIEEKLSKENLKTFNLKRFRQNRGAGEEVSPYEQMHVLKRYIQNYTRKFSHHKNENILFYGPVGTGKTFLCNCIAKEVLDAGFLVIYMTAPKLLSFLNDVAFSQSADRSMYRERREALFNADLLIIDDLGTEFITTVTTSHLFELLNERMIAQRATILSTNLYPEEIMEVYGTRVFSRLFGEYRQFHIYGEDLRLKR